MGKWEMVRLGDVCNLNMGQSPESSSYNETGEGLPFYQGNADFGVLYPIIRYHCSVPKKIALPNDILLSVRAPIGALNIANEKCCIGRGLAALTPFKTLEMKYLYYILKDNHTELNAKGTGSTFKAINKSSLNDFEIPLPPLEIQQKIAAALDTADALLKLHQQHLAELEALIQSVFYQMFGDPVRNEKGWEIDNFDRIIEFMTSGSRGWSKYFAEQGEFFITIKNVRNSKIIKDNMQKIKAPDNKESLRTKVQENDLLISITADLGRTAVVDKDTATNGAYINQHLCLIRLDLEKIVPIFLAIFLESPGGQSQFQKKNQVGVKSGLNFDSIKSLRVPIPPLPLQTQFAAIVQKIEQQKALVQQSIDETQTLFESLMSRYFD